MNYNNIVNKYIDIYNCNSDYKLFIMIIIIIIILIIIIIILIMK